MDTGNTDGLEIVGSTQGALKHSFRNRILARGVFHNETSTCDDFHISCVLAAKRLQSTVSREHRAIVK